MRLVRSGVPGWFEVRFDNFNWNLSVKAAVAERLSQVQEKRLGTLELESELVEFFSSTELPFNAAVEFFLLHQESKHGIR